MLFFPAQSPTTLTLTPSCDVNRLQAQGDKLVQLDFYGFEFQARNNETGDATTNKCLRESVELRLNDSFKGTFHCGSDIKYGTVMTSSASQVIIIINADDAMIGRGMRVWVDFVGREPVATVLRLPPTKRPASGSGPIDRGLTLVPFDIITNVLGILTRSLQQLRLG